MPYQITELIGGIALMTGLILAAALMGWLAARLILRATDPDDARDGRHGSETRT